MIPSLARDVALQGAKGLAASFNPQTGVLPKNGHDILHAGGEFRRLT